jgi:hypothetical protein
VFLGSIDLEYGALALGNIAGGNNAFVKIQAATGAGTFDQGAFYTGNNGSGVYFAPSRPSPAWPSWMCFSAAPSTPITTGPRSALAAASERMVLRT